MLSRRKKEALLSEIDVALLRGVAHPEKHRRLRAGYAAAEGFDDLPWIFGASVNQFRSLAQGPNAVEPLGTLLNVIRNPVVEYTYAKEDRVVASCDYRRVGEPLQESEGPRRTLAPSDRVAAERGDEDRGGLGGHWIQPGLGAQNSPPLQRVGRGCSWRSSSFQSGCQAEGSLGRVRRRGVA